MELFSSYPWRTRSIDGSVVDSKGRVLHQSSSLKAKRLLQITKRSGLQVSDGNDVECFQFLVHGVTDTCADKTQ